MRTVFADTSFYVAFCNPRDSLHGRAVEFSRSFAGRLLTTEYVLLECGSAFSRAPDRWFLPSLVESLRASPFSRVVDSQRELFDAGLELFRSRPDKDWSLTDCISFKVMEHHGLTEAATADHHFVQAGFVALLLNPDA
jgi:uncharacterized protein